MDPTPQASHAPRSDVPLDDLANFEPSDARPSPVDVIISQNRERLHWLVPIRHWRMSRSPLSFYRGAAKLMALDLANSPTSGLRAQICGDAHLSNFGFYGSPERALLFDLNDFDETLPGPWEWDIKRLAASFAITARHNGLGRESQRNLALRSAAAYREAIVKLAGMGYLDIWYSRIDETELNSWFGDQLGNGQRKALDKVIGKTKKKDSRRALGNLAEKDGKGYRIVSHPPLIVPIRDLEAAVDPDQLEAGIRQAFTEYVASVPDHVAVLLRKYKFRDLALKVVGVGSVGTRCFIVLLEGRDLEDPLFLQVKEATRSVLEDHLPTSEYRYGGQRVVKGQRLMQSASDIFLGWSRQDVSGHQYYWRQLKDMKGSVEVEDLDSEGLDRYAKLCGWALARAHARTVDTQRLAGYLGKSDEFDDAIGRFSVSYADQNDTDYDQFVAAVDNGTLPAYETSPPLP